MKYRYDLHIHSALSPCADNDMTPVSIVGYAKLSGLDIVAVSDHNSIKNVRVAMAAGEAYGICVVPAVEVQTSEDVHILCLFPDCEELEAFCGEIEFSKRLNREDIFGEQLIFDEEDEIVGRESAMLLDSAKISCVEIVPLAAKYSGIAVPAHIDRETNGMLQILGSIPEEFNAVELSTRAGADQIELWKKTRRVIVDSDSHTLSSISLTGEIELPAPTARHLIEYLSSRL